MRARAIPRPAYIALAIATLLSLTLLPTPTFGAKGDQIEVDLNALIPQISGNGTAAFEAEFDNNGSSTITHLTFSGAIAGGTLNGPSNCTQTGTRFNCVLGTVPARTGVAVRLLFAPAGEGSLVISDARFAADASQGNPTSTKQDVWPSPETAGLSASVLVDGEGGNFYGTWRPAHADPVSGIQVGTTSRQRTSVTIPPFGEDYPLMLGQIGEGAICDGYTSQFGDTVSLDAANGVSPGQPIKVVIEYTREAADRKNPSQIGILHDCVEVARGCSSGQLPCFDAAWAGSGQNRLIRVTLLLDHNGLIKGW